MDPTDLLFTNNYVPSLENLNNVRKIKEEDELKTFLKNKLFDKPKIIPRNSSEYSQDFNVLKNTISHPKIMTRQPLKIYHYQEMFNLFLINKIQNIN